MPQIALVLCRSPYLILKTNLVEQSFMWSVATLIEETGDYTTFESLSSVRADVNSYFII